jgi:uncharacterized protein involved in exopolysaccharide biosynthesis
MDRIHTGTDASELAPRPANTNIFAGESQDESENERLIDTDLILNWLKFTAGSIWRNRVIAAVTCAVTFGTIWALAVTWPKTYHSYGRLLVQQNEVMPSLVNPNRTVPQEGAAPTWAAQEIVRSRQNLLAIMKEINLLEEWERSRPALAKARDWIFSWVRESPGEAARLEALAGVLEERIQVVSETEGSDGIVTFTAQWRDPRIAHQLVDKSMHNFLEYRRVTQMSAISDSIVILDRSIQDLESQINTTISQLRRRSTTRPAAIRRTGPATRAALPTGPSPETTVRLARLKSALELRQQEVMRQDAARAQQLAETQARLAAAQTIYTDGHPTVVALRQAMSQLSREPPELAAARREAQNLELEYDALSTKISVETEAAERAKAAMSQQPSFTSVSAPVPSVDIASLINGGDPTEPVSLRLRVEMAQLAAVRERANAARAELASSEVGFKYQYSILRPAQLPRRPIAPNVPLILAAGAVFSLLLAVAVALGLDLFRGRILEAWQVERQVGVPVSLRVPKL